MFLVLILVKAKKVIYYLFYNYINVILYLFIIRKKK